MSSAQDDKGQTWCSNRDQEKTWFIFYTSIGCRQSIDQRWDTSGLNRQLFVDEVCDLSLIFRRIPTDTLPLGITAMDRVAHHVAGPRPL